MHIRDLLNYGNEQLAKYNLNDWTIVVEKTRRRLGQCRYREHEIGISGYHILNNPDDYVKDTVLHEIAHALAGSKARHGPAWKLRCLEVGARPSTLAPAFLRTQAKKGIDKAIEVWYIDSVKGKMPRKRDKTMTPQQNGSTTTTPNSKPVTKTVFDLERFDDVKLTKTVVLPVPVTSVEEALAAVGNDASALLAVINDGLAERATEAAKSDNAGWHEIDENDKTSDSEYQGKFASDEKTKLINAGVLNMAKMYAGGSWDTLSKEKKRELKNQAIELIRNTPAMIQSLVG